MKELKYGFIMIGFYTYGVILGLFEDMIPHWCFYLSAVFIGIFAFIVTKYITKEIRSKNE